MYVQYSSDSSIIKYCYGCNLDSSLFEFYLCYGTRIHIVVYDACNCAIVREIISATVYCIRYASSCADIPDFGHKGTCSRSKRGTYAMLVRLSTDHDGSGKRRG
jgi:hypothetical protein